MNTPNPFKKLDFGEQESENLEVRVRKSVELHKTLLDMATLFTTNAVNTLAEFIGGRNHDKPSKTGSHDENTK
jgi:hypothetical protein